MSSHARASAPWHIGNQLSVLFLSLIGLGGIVFSWWMVAGTAEAATQQRWIDVGVVALLLATVGDVAYLLAGRRSVRTRVRSLALRMARLADAGLLGDGDVAESSTGTVVTAPRMSRYHRSDCLLVRGKAVSRGTVAENERAGRRPCGVCMP
jgi:hypothetical protein